MKKVDLTIEKSSLKDWCMNSCPDMVCLYTKPFDYCSRISKIMQNIPIWGKRRSLSEDFSTVKMTFYINIFLKFVYFFSESSFLQRFRVAFTGGNNYKSRR